MQAMRQGQAFFHDGDEHVGSDGTPDGVLTAFSKVPRERFANAAGSADGETGVLLLKRGSLVNIVASAHRIQDDQPMAVTQ